MIHFIFAEMRSTLDCAVQAVFVFVFGAELHYRNYNALQALLTVIRREDGGGDTLRSI
jgi:hypothetical protein